jgi:2,4-dienoyl-CoA reductase-like NADH-dependent reductase (Old Yellow Enzyme family)
MNLHCHSPSHYLTSVFFASLRERAYCIFTSHTLHLYSIFKSAHPRIFKFSYFYTMLFTPVTIGPLSLRNRSIRAAAFEGMSAGHDVSDSLIDYHSAVARGGIGMTTVAYSSVTRSGLSFPHQLWMRQDIVPHLRLLTDAVHQHGAAASIQLGHCGNMAKQAISGSRPLAPSARFNMYAPSYPRAMSRTDISDMAKSFGQSVRLAQDAGFDAVEIHAGHGYLISQFLSPYTNHRTDEFGGSLSNRMRFAEMVMNEVMEAAGSRTAVLVKVNMRDGFDGGMEIDESLQFTKMLEQKGIHALVLSGGFVSRAPMYVMRGSMPIGTLAAHMDNPLMGSLVRVFGKWLVPDVPFRENYFLQDAKRFRRELKMPLVYVGGILSAQNIDEVLAEGFDAVAIARALIRDPDFVNKIKADRKSASTCDTCNHCIAVMYNGPFQCIQNINVQ